jgi:hypothetical protein
MLTVDREWAISDLYAHVARELAPGAPQLVASAWRVRASSRGGKRADIASTIGL